MAHLYGCLIGFLFLPTGLSEDAIPSTAPAGICPLDYKLTVNFYREFVCQYIHPVPLTWTDARIICRQNMADIGVGTVLNVSQSGPTFHFYKPDRKLVWWINWKRRSDSLQQGSSLSPTLLRGWYREAVYGNAGSFGSGRATQRLSNLQQILDFEISENFRSLLGIHNISVDWNTTGNCATFQKDDTTLRISARSCDKEVYNFVCEINVKSLQTAVSGYIRYVTPKRGEIKFYEHYFWSMNQVAERFSALRKVPALAGVIQRSHEECDQVFPTNEIAVLNYRGMAFYSTVLVEAPTSQTCYFVPVILNPGKDDVGMSSEEAAKLCQQFNATTIKPLDFGQHYYARFLLPLVSRYQQNLDISLPGAWVDARMTTVLPVIGPHTSPQPPLAGMMNWTWSNGQPLSREIIPWIKISEEDLSRPPAETCVTERVFNFSNYSYNPFPELNSSSVPWITYPCGSRAEPVCQRSIPPRTVHALKVTVTVAMLNTIGYAANKWNIAKQNRDLPLLQCGSDGGSLVNMKSVVFFGPLDADRGMAGKEFYTPYHYDYVKPNLKESSNPADSENPQELVWKSEASSEMGCYINAVEVSCGPLGRNIPPISADGQMSIGQLNSSGNLFGRWTYMALQSGYYQCAMMLRETEQWHYSTPILVKDKAVRFVFQLPASAMCGSQLSTLTNHTKHAFGDWLKLRSDGGNLSHPFGGQVVFSIQTRRHPTILNNSTGNFTWNFHATFHKVASPSIQTPARIRMDYSAIAGTTVTATRDTTIEKTTKPSFVDYSQKRAVGEFGDTRLERENMNNYCPDQSSSPFYGGKSFGGEGSFGGGIGGLPKGEDSHAAQSEPPIQPDFFGEFSGSEELQLRQFAEWLNSNAEISRSVNYQPGHDWFKSTDSCPAKKMSYANGEFHWLATESGEAGDFSAPLDYCPDYEFRRKCIGNFDDGYTAIYPSEPCSQVLTPKPELVLRLLHFLANPPYGSEKIDRAALNISDWLSGQTNNLTATDLNYLSAFLQMIARNAGGRASSGLLRSIVTIIDYILKSPPTELGKAQNSTGSSNRLIISLEILADGIVFDPTRPSAVGSDPFRANLPLMAIDIFTVPDASILVPETIIGFAAAEESRTVSLITRNDSETSTKDETAVSISLPDSLIKRLQNISASTPGGLRGHYLVIRNATFLGVDPLDDLSNNVSTTSPQKLRRIASWIIGASFGFPIYNLTDNVTITAKVDEYKSENNYTCVFWSMTAREGFGAWESDGCFLEEYSNKHIICKCNHLTSFAVLVNYFGEFPTDKLSISVLDNLTTVALAISIAGLILTVCLIFFSKKIFQNSSRAEFSRNEFVLINLSLALMSGYVAFLTGIDSNETRGGCIAAGSLIHFFFLVTFFWQAVEGILLLVTFVATTTTTGFRHFRVKTMIACWGCPVGIVGIVLAIDAGMYVGADTSDVDVFLCWIGAGRQSQAAFYATFIGPICLMLLSNMVVFGMVIRELSCVKKLEIRSTKNKEDLLTQFRRAGSLFFLLGLPWILLTLNVIHLTNGSWLSMQILTVIFCGCQGLAIFLIEAYGKRKVLKEFLGKCHKRSYSFRPSKNMTSRTTLATDGNSSNSSSAKDFELQTKKDF